MKATVGTKMMYCHHVMWLHANIDRMPREELLQQWLDPELQVSIDACLWGALHDCITEWFNVMLLA